LEKFPTMKNFYPLIISLLLFLCTKAQILVVTPINPTTDDSVTIIYDATKGNGALANHTGPVFAHTGLITTNSTSPNNWYYVQGNWGTYDTARLMTPLGNNLYSISYHIRTFYNVPQNEQVLRLAFVFRNVNGSLVGRDANNQDIFYDINLLTPQTITSFSMTSGVMTILCDTGALRLTRVKSNVIKIQFSPTGQFLPQNSIVTSGDTPKPAIGLQTPLGLIFGGADVAVLVKSNPVRIAYIYKNDTLLRDERGLWQQYTRKGISFSLDSTERLYGTGSRAIKTNRRGEELDVYNTAVYGYGPGAKTLNITFPFVVSSKGYGILFDNYAPSKIDLGKNNPSEMRFSFDEGDLTYYFIGGSQYDEVLRGYAQVTGFQPLPPRWSLGYIQSRYGYQSETEARQVVNALRNQGFPLDALVLDLYWFGSPATMGNFSWDYSKFPNPIQMISDFNTAGVKTILITEPYFTQQSTKFPILSQNGWLAKNTQGQPFIINGFWAGNAGLIDLTNDSALDYFWSLYPPRINEGVGGWWCDLGEPENHPATMIHHRGTARQIHNSYSILWARRIFEGYQQQYPGQRLFNLIRSGFAGMQRYSTFPWSGDVQRSWGGLKVQIPNMLGMSMSGIGYMHSDLGGFTGGGQDPELYTRWFQLGTFSPIMRAHGEGVPPEPYNYPTFYKNICLEYARLRYRFLPYNYHLAFINSTTGTPLAIPSDYYNPGNLFLADRDEQYLWGKNILVAPVLDANTTSKTVYFPPGKWVDFHTNLQYTGLTQTSISAPIGKLPFFVRSGAILAMAPEHIKTTAFYTYDTLILRNYKDDLATSDTLSLYTDNGISPGALAMGNYAFLNFISAQFGSDYHITCSLSGPGYSGMPNTRFYRFELVRYQQAPTSVEWNNQLLQSFPSLSQLVSNSTGYYYDQNQKILYAQVYYNNGVSTLKIQHGITSNLENNLSPLTTVPFPNPTSGDLFLEVLDYDQQSVIEIFDLLGRRLFADKIVNLINVNNHVYINLRNLSMSTQSQVLIIRINHKGITKTHKLVFKTM
jgi:oligosaccharide 4-alpha-D-glucosyltransferase